MRKTIIYFILILTMLNIANAYTISGSSVYIDDSKVYLEANPHTMANSGYVYVTLNSKVYSGDIDFAIGVDSTNAKMTSFEIWTNITLVNQTIPIYTIGYYNETTNTSIILKNYTYISGYDYTYMIGEGWKRYNLTSITYNYDGKNVWHVGRNVNVNAAKQYNARFYLEVNPNTHGKYDIAIKPSAETIAQAVTNSHFYLLDPWFNSSYAYRLPINCSSMTVGTPLVINGSNGFAINGFKQVVWTICTGGNLSVYYNNISDYIVANDTGLVPKEVEFGNGTSSSNFKSIWNGYLVVYHFGGNSTSSATFDSSNWSRHSTTISGAITYLQQCPNGYIGGCYQFTSNANSRIESTVLDGWANPTSSKKLSAMAYINYTTTGSSHNPFVLNWGTGTSEEAQGMMVGNSATYNNSINVLDNSAGSTWYQHGSNTKVQPNVPNLMFFSEDTTKLNTTLNGVFDRTETTNGIGDMTKYFQIGSFHSYYEPLVQMIGIVDEVRVYNGILSNTYSNEVYQNIQGTNGYGKVSSQETRPPDYTNESQARTAIETGINSALTSKTIYYDQRIYTYSGTHNLGKFDLVAVYGNKWWAFNYVNSSESYTNIPSMGTTLNIWENASLTSDQITLQVETLINATKS